MYNPVIASRRASIELLSSGSSSSTPSYFKSYRTDSCYTSKYGGYTSSASLTLDKIYSRRLPDGPGPLDWKGKPLSSETRYSRTPRYNENSSLSSYTKPFRTTDYSPSSTSSSKYLSSNYTSTLSKSYRSPSSSLYSGGTLRSSRASSVADLPSTQRRYSDFRSPDNYGTSRLRASSQSRTVDVESRSAMGSRSRAPSVDVAMERLSYRSAKNDPEPAAENCSNRSTSMGGWRAKVYCDRPGPVSPLSDQTNHINNAATRRPVVKIDDQDGMAGLVNLGNSCFMNSIIQCLNKSNLLLNYITSDQYKLDIAKPGAARFDGNLLRAFSEIMKLLWTSRMEVSPIVFRNSIKKLNPIYQGFGQEDAHEFYNHLVNGLHEELDTTKKNAPRGVDSASWYDFCKGDTKITDIFAMQMKHSYKCVECSTEFTEYHTSFDLSMPMKKAIRVVEMEDLMKDFTDCTSNNMCKKCAKLTLHDCLKEFVHLPEVIVLYFQRAEKLGKLKTEMQYPVDHLDLSKYIHKGYMKSSKYSLYAVCCHAGDCATSGHYWAECLHPRSSEWNKYNDTRVTCTIKGHSATGSRECVFFYKRK